MSTLTRIVPSIFNLASRFTTKINPTVTNFHSLTPCSSSNINPGGLFSIATRSIIRNHFPRPSERKRVKVHGWKTRMSTPFGRRIIMNRILKGRFVYSH